MIFCSHSQMWCKLCKVINFLLLYDITLAIHSHTEVTIVTWYLQQTVSLDDLEQDHQTTTGGPSPTAKAFCQ